MRRAARISDFLEEILAGQGLSSVTTTVRLRASWRAIVGPLLAAKTAPARLKNGVLTVLVLNHAWAQELQLRKPVLIEQANAALGKDSVKEIRLSVEPLPEEEEENDASPPARKEPLPFVPEPEGMAGISDPEMRQILRSIARRIASLKR